MTIHEELLLDNKLVKPKNFFELVNFYLDLKKVDCRLSSYETSLNRINSHILPSLKNKDLPLTIVDLVNFKKSLANLTPAYKRNLYNELSCILNIGKRYFNIDNNNKIVPNFKKEPKKLVRVYTIEDFKILRKHFKTDNLKTLFDLYYFLGLRRGEGLALTPADIKDGFLYIDKTYSRNRIVRTKTVSSARRIKLNDFLLKELEKESKYKNTNERLFNYSYTTLKRYLDKAIKDSNLTSLNIKGFRHSNITNLLYAGVNPHLIAKRVGHSNTDTLFNSYAELVESEETRVNKILEKEYKKL